MENDVTCLERRVVTQIAERMSSSCYITVDHFSFISIQACGSVLVEALHPGFESSET
jgi:hypothetical protein